MELMKGYKQTELGIFPVDWEIISIDKIFTFYSTSNYSKAQMSFDGEVGCIHYGLIHAIPNTFYNVQKGIKYFINQEQAKYETIKNGDIVMVDASEDLEGVNKSVELSGIENGKYIAGLHTFLLRDTNSLLANNFRGAILNSTIIKNQLLRLAVGMKVFGVSKPQLKTILIPVPPFSEQTAIADALSNIDELISQTEKLIDKKKAIKQGVMQELLKPKKGWVTKRISEVCWFQEGPGVRKHQFTQSGVKLLNGTNIQEGKLDLENTDKFISEDEAFGWYSHFLVDENDILIACSGVSIDKFQEKVTVAKVFNLPLCMNTSTMRFKVKKVYLDQGYFIQFLKSKRFKEQISGKATGSAQLNFGPSHVTMVEIDLPSIEIQNKIGQVLSDMEMEIGNFELKLKKLSIQKQGMMQALLTGKIRLL